MVLKEQKEIQSRTSNNKQSKDLPLINENIKIDNLQVISVDGANYGIISRVDALEYAREAGLDLVLLAENGSMDVPVAKIMDYGKDLYARKKKHAEAKKNTKVVQIKEIKMKPKIGEHDYQIKIHQGIEFLKDGKKLKITLVFGKGREMLTRTERGLEMFERIRQAFVNAGIFDNVVEEKEASMGVAWSKIYYLKKIK